LIVLLEHGVETLCFEENGISGLSQSLVVEEFGGFFQL